MRWTRRNVIIGIAIGLLVVLNILRWWPTSLNSSDGSHSEVRIFALEDFRLNGIREENLVATSRDIFHPKAVPVKKVQIKNIVPIAPSVPEKTHEEIAKETAQAEFAEIRCVGVSIRNKKFQAYLINAGESFLISNGDKVGSRFVVENIVPDGVSLRDPETDVGGLIAVSGK